MNASRAQLIDNQYHTLREHRAEKRESSGAKTPCVCVTPVRGADAFFSSSLLHPSPIALRHSTTQHPLLRAGV